MQQRAKQAASCAGCHVRQPLKTLAARNRAALLQCGSSTTEGLSAPVPVGEEERASLRLPDRAEREGHSQVCSVGSL